MITELSKPNVIGEVDKALLLTLEHLSPTSEGVDDTCYEQLPLYEEIARLAGIELVGREMIGRSRMISPGRSQQQFPTSGWHTENNEGLLVADAIPTEFLMAEEDVLRSFWQRHCHEGPMPANGLTLLNLRRVSSQSVRMDDKQIRNEGFKIWSANPLEVVPLGPADIHRSPKNSSIGSVRRNYAMIFREVVPER